MGADPGGARTLFVAAAEPSGDALGAALAPCLRGRLPGLRILGLAGPRMRAAGVEAVARSEDAVGFGLAEVVRQIPRSLRLLRRLEEEVERSGAEVVLTVDAPSLLLRLGRRLRPRRTVIHWVSPQIWAWRPGRAATLGRSADAVMCLLPFEPRLYQGRIRAVFVGHPAAAIRPEPRPLPGRPTVALCPGSRPTEIAALWPVFREVARALRARWPEAGFVVPVAPSVPREAIGGLDALYVDRIAEVAGADAALVASGTATLELAALDVPMAVAYRVHPLTAAIARRVLTVRDIALPNLLAGRRLVPEHVQELDPEAIGRDLIRIAGTRGQVPRELVASLCGEEAIERAADEVAGWLGAEPAEVDET